MSGSRIVGVLGAPAVARVESCGEIQLDECALGWLVGAEDRWHDPRDDAAVRQSRIEPAPAYETRIRIPSGDAVQRVYGARARDNTAYVVVDVENASPAPFAIAFVLRASSGGRAAISLDGSVAYLDDRAQLALPRPPMRWSTAPGATGTRAAVTTGAAAGVPFQAVRDVQPEAAFIFPVAHRTSLRVVLALDAVPQVHPVLPDDVPAIGAVQRGWVAQLDRAMRVELPGVLGERIDGARATLLLEGALADPAPTTIANLEDWGFDTEAIDAWSRASFLTRRRAARRGAVVDLQARLATASDDEVLRYARDLLVLDRKTDIDLLPGFVPAWVGESLTVHDAPTRAGNVSFAIRWHGERPALLWDAPAGVTLRVPVVDPSWSAPGGTGEALLAPWTAA